MRIAVASVNFSSPFTGFVYGQVKKRLRPGESILECVTHHQYDCDFSRQRLLALLESDPKPAALIAICIKPGPEVIQAFRAAGAPVVIVDEEAEGASTVAADNAAVGRLAAERLIAGGRSALAIVSGRSRLPGGFSSLHRQKGFRAALAEAGIPLPEDRVVEVPDYSHKDGATALPALAEKPGGVDGIFCAAGDTCAAGMLSGARAKGIDVPARIAVVSCDDLPIAAISDPPLTTIRQPLDAIAEEAHRLATQETAEILQRPKTVLLQPTLVVRKSG